MSRVSNCRKEVEEFHAVLQAWLSGDEPRNNESLMRFINSIDDECILIAPGGTVESSQSLIARLSNAFGVSRGIRIWTTDFALIEGFGSFVLARYTEWREIDGAKNSRYTTVLFVDDERSPNGVKWRHIHETWAH
jgi:hypothetical protein